MYAKQYCLVLLLAIICVTLADFDSFLNEADKTKVTNVAEDIFQVGKMCNAANPCANGGECVQNVCKCLKGTSGDLCETIDDCKGKEKCGYEPCLYNVSSKEAYCKCEGSLKFDDEYKMCKECSCGSSYTKSCEFVNGKKRCNCIDHYEDRLGICALCNCTGASRMYGCKFDEVGNKICPCVKGYAQQGDECKKCDCGDHGKCRLGEWGTKYCTCDEGYTEYLEKCKECNCGTKGTCKFDSYRGEKMCSCQSGYKEYEGTCKACYCGRNAKCQFNPVGDIECTCDSGYGMKNGSCTPCNCHPGTKCTFDTSNHSMVKTCDDCPKGYADDKGNCRVCDCGAKGSVCSFSVGYNRCQCPQGYKEELRQNNTLDRTCVEMDGCKTNHCPLSSTKCVNKLGNYKCVCKEGYEGPYSSDEVEKQGCTDINECKKNLKPCNDSDAVCVNTPGSYKCECRYGYSLKASEEKMNVCFSLGYLPLRITASIIIGVSATVVIIGLIITIVKKY